MSSLRGYLLFLALPLVCLLSSGCVLFSTKEERAECRIRTSVNGVLKSATRKKRVPGGVALVNWRGEDVFKKSFGSASLSDKRVPMRDNHRFDVASLTKVVATITSVLILEEQGKIGLDDPVSKHLTAFKEADKKTITVRHCLTHTSGLPGFRRYYTEMKGRKAYLKAISSEKLSFAPGSKHGYSDLGFILLGFLVEEVSGETLDSFTRDHIFKPLGMKNTGFRPVGAKAASAKEFAATEFCKWREKLMVGEVHDENAYALGGVAGHAGLFSTADDLSKFGQMLLQKGEWGGGRILSPGSVALLNRAQVPDIEPLQGFGWRLCPQEQSDSGFLGSPRSFGHTGFTGTSLWLDPDNQMVAVLLTNGIHPDRTKGDIGKVRLDFHRAITRAMGERVGPRVKTGLDILEAKKFKPLSGRRVAVVTNQTAINAHGEHLLDLLKEYPAIEVTAIFGPEHGVRGNVEAGAKVEDSAADSIPVYSLYGKNRKPTEEMGETFDLVLYDIQDVGARFYTYIWTLMSMMQFCAETGKPLIVIDRPNPLGGLKVEGPVLDERFASFVGMKPIALRYGLTIGELAVLFNKQGWLGDGLKAKLKVIKMKGWGRSMLFPDTGLPWVPPSPNMPSWDTAMVYPGTCMFEGVSWSEGRGLTVPFETVGGPVVDSEKLAAELGELGLPGCTFLPVSFTPRSLPGVVSEPKHKDKECGGVFIRVDDPETFQPVKTGLAILTTLKNSYPDSHKWRTSHFDRLMGTDKVRLSIDAGADPNQISASWEADLKDFNEIREEVMLYPR